MRARRRWPKDAFDFAAMLTNDTDRVEPVRIVTQELGLPVTLLTPIAKPATSLARVMSSVRHIQPYIGPCQLPDEIPLPAKKPISKPTEWVSSHWLPRAALLVNIVIGGAHAYSQF
jgi:hypothetical protein